MQSLSNYANSSSVISSDCTGYPSSSPSVASILVVWRCGCYLELVHVVGWVRDFLAEAGAECSLLDLTIRWRVSAAVFAASSASWYCLSNVFNTQ